jgi:hypothetical protein
MTAFWDIAPCSLTDVSEVRTTSIRLDDGSSKNLWNVGLLLWDCKALYPRKLSSLYSPPWEPAISQTWYLELKEEKKLQVPADVERRKWFGPKVYVPPMVEV